MNPLIASAVIVLCEGLCFGAVLPVIGFYCEHLGGGPITLGLLFALLAGPKVIMNPLLGRASDRYGRRPVLLISTLGTFAGSVLWALAPNVIWLAVSRGVVGVFGAQAAIAQAVAADVTPPARRAAAMGVLGAAFGLSITLGPLLGGLVSTAASNAAVGWMCALLQALSIIVILALLPETRGPGAAPAEWDAAADRGAPAVNGESPACDTDLTTLAPLLHRPAVRRLMLVTLLMWLGFSVINGTFQLLAAHAYQMSERQVSYAYAVIGIVGAVIQGGLIRRLSASWGEQVCGLAGLVILIVAFLLLAATPPEPGFWLATTLLAMGSAVAVPCIAGLVSQAVDEAEQGAVLGLHQGVIGLGRAGGAAVGGALYALAGAPLVYGTAATVIVAGGWLLRRLPAASPSPKSD